MSHAGDNLKSIQSTMANINFDQCMDGSGSAAELFLQRTLRVPGLAVIPTYLEGINNMKAAHGASHQK